MPKPPFLMAVLLAAAAALAYEEPADEMLCSGDDHEVGDYAPYLAAETTVPGGSANPAGTHSGDLRATSLATSLGGKLVLPAGANR